MAQMILTATFYYAVTLSQFTKDTFDSQCKGPSLNLARSQSTYYGTSTAHVRGSVEWNNLPANIESSNSVFEFKNKVKNLGNIDCGSLICQ